MRFTSSAALPGLILGAMLASAAGSGCNSYTGAVRNELVSEKRIEEKVSKDELDVEMLNLPTPEKPFVKLKISWVFRKEYRVQKTFKVLREYYPYEAGNEILEVVSSPFMFLLSLPAGLLMAPFELLLSKDAKDGRLTSWNLMKMPFEFIHPAYNSDEWAVKANVYGKTAMFEDTGTPNVENSPVIEQKEDKIASGARVTVILPELNKSMSLRADDSGTALFRLTDSQAQLSQEGKGLTIRFSISFGDRKATREVIIDPSALGEIYEKLVMG